MLLLLVVVLVGLVLVNWWLFRRRSGDESRQQMAEELTRVVNRIGLGTVWDASMFQADVYGIRGEVNGYDVRAELWDKTRRDFFRLAIRFPRPIHQGFRLRTRRRRGLEHLWRMERVERGDDVFDDRFNIYCRPEPSQRIEDLFDTQVCRKLVDLERKVDGIKLGDHCLYVYIDSAVEPVRIERLIREGLAVATRLYDRSMDLGPSKTSRNTAYETITIDALGRDSGEELDIEAFPEGTVAEDLGLGGDEDGENTDSETKARKPGREKMETRGMEWTRRTEAIDGDSEPEARSAGREKVETQGLQWTRRNEAVGADSEASTADDGEGGASGSSPGGAPASSVDSPPSSPGSSDEEVSEAPEEEGSSSQGDER